MSEATVKAEKINRKKNKQALTVRELAHRQVGDYVVHLLVVELGYAGAAGSHSVWEDVPAEQQARRKHSNNAAMHTLGAFGCAVMATASTNTNICRTRSPNDPRP